MRVKQLLITAVVLASCLAVLPSLSVGQNEEKPAVIQNAPFADNGEEGMPKMIQVYMEMIEISSIDYAEMMSGSSGSAHKDHSQMRMKLLEKVKDGSAKIVASQSVLTKPGDHAEAESFQEYINETEYGIESKLPTEELAKAMQNFFKAPPIPVAFQRNNLGLSMNVEAGLNEDETININLWAELSEHVGDNILTTWKTDSYERTITRPIIYSFYLRTAFNLRPDSFIKVSTHTPDLDGKPDHSRKVIVFVKASLLELER